MTSAVAVVDRLRIEGERTAAEPGNARRRLYDVSVLSALATIQVLWLSLLGFWLLSFVH